MSGKPSKLVVGLVVFVGLAAMGQLAQMATGETAVEQHPRPTPSAASRPAQNEPAAPPTQPTAAPQPVEPTLTQLAEPTAAQLAMDEAFFKAAKRNPAADNYKRVARQLKNTAEEVLEGMSAVAEYRAALLAEAKRSVPGVVGELDIKDVVRTELGAHTALVSFTAVRCPEGDPRRDQELELLVTTALKKLAAGLPAPIDSYRAALWYRGLSCDRGSVGYGATWTRPGGIELK